MKRWIIFFVTVLVGGFVTLSLLDYKSEYLAEKIIWRINKDFVQAAKDPKSVPETNFTALIKQYNQFADRFPESKYAPVAKMNIGRLYILREKYPLAREHLESVINNYSVNREVSVQAMAEIAFSYNAEKDYRGVIKVYERIIKEYPLSVLGLRCPLLIAQMYAKLKENKKSEDAINRAIAYYAHHRQ